MLAISQNHVLTKGILATQVLLWFAYALSVHGDSTVTAISVPKMIAMRKCCSSFK